MVNELKFANGVALFGVVFYVDPKNLFALRKACVNVGFVVHSHVVISKKKKKKTLLSVFAMLCFIILFVNTFGIQALIYMQMADLNFIVEINYGGKFVWNPNLKYVGGNITTIEDVYPNKPSFFFFFEL